MDNVLFYLLLTKGRYILPQDTGLLRFEAFKGFKTYFGATYKVDLNVSPYFEWLDKGIGPVTKYEGIFDDLLAVMRDEITGYYTNQRPYLKKKLAKRQQELQDQDEATNNARRAKRRDTWQKRTRGFIE